MAARMNVAAHHNDNSQHQFQQQQSQSQSQMSKRASNIVDLNIWKHYLYELQLKAPTPKRIVCHEEKEHRPMHYGREFHGVLTREQGDELLMKEGGEDGRYLVRESYRNPGQMTLSLRFNNVAKNFRLYYDGKHYVGDKRFDTIHDLVADGLITLYLDLHASDYIANIQNACKYEESPYMTIHKQNQKRQPEKANKKLKSKSSRKSGNFQVERILNYNDIPEEEEQTEENELNINVQHYEKSHVFKTHNFMGLPWCDYCANFMWGLISQGVKCQDCGFSAHRKCSEKVPNDCCPDLAHIRRIFGVDLTTFVKASNNVRPFIVDLCVREIERRGLSVEGIYRVSGFADDVQSLKSKFESEWDQMERILSQCEDIHVITGVLKLYFRLLPIPLITYDAYPHFLAAIKKSSRLSSLKEAINTLPPAHYQTLKYFIAHLNRVTLNEQNLMSANNLAMVFCPTLMRTPNIGCMFQVSCWQDESDVLETLITNHSKLFHK